MTMHTETVPCPCCKGEKTIQGTTCERCKGKGTETTWKT